MFRWLFVFLALPLFGQITQYPGTSGNAARLPTGPCLVKSDGSGNGSCAQAGTDYINAAGAASAAPVQTVAGRTGAVTLTHSDVADFNASAASAAPVQTVAGRTGTVTLTHSDVTDFNTAASSVAPVQSVNGQTGAVSTLGPTTIPTTTGATYYVSQSLGLDTNNGTSPATPWKSISKVNSSTFNPGDQVLFYDQDVWHEQLTVPSSGSLSAPITFSNYGPNACPTGNNTQAAPVSGCSMPIIDGSDVVTGWTVQSGTTYKASYASTAVKGFVDALYVESTPLALQTSIVNVNSTAGSIYSDGTYVYVHLLDGTNPTNHIIEISGGRKYGIYGSGKSHIIIAGMEILRSSFSNIAWIDSSSNTGGSTGGDYLTVQNSSIFNCGNSGSLGGDSTFNAQGCIIVQGYASTGQSGLSGLAFTSNYIGHFDFTGAPTVDDGRAGYLIYNATGALIRGGKVATGTEMGVMFRDWFGPNTNNSQNVVDSVELTNNQGNVSFGGCTGCTAKNNQIHDSFGYGIGVGDSAIVSSTGSTGTQLLYNNIRNLKPSLDGSLYNGVDCNANSSGGTAIGNAIYGVAGDSFTLEADNSQPCSGWTLLNNMLDSSTNVAYNGASSGNYLGPLYVRDLSTVGLTLTNNTYIIGTNSGVLRYGSTSASDHTHDYTTVAQFVSSGIALTDAAIIATNAALGNHFRVTLGGNRTLAAPTNPVDGQKVTWELIQDGTGSRTITLASAFHFGTDVTGVTLTTTAGKRDFLGAIYNSTTGFWYVVSFAKGY